MIQQIGSAIAPGLSEHEMELRRSFVGASESAAILGVNPYETAGDVWHRKINNIQKKQTRGMLLGRLYEPLLLDFAREHLGVEIHQKNRRRVHPNGIMQATIDGFIAGRREVVEAKKVDYHAWAADPEQWGEPGTDQIPRYYIVQVQHQLAVLTAQTGEPWDTAHVVVAIGDDDFRHYVIPRHPKLAEVLQKQVTEFWTKYVVPQVPPPEMASVETLVQVPRSSKSVFHGIDDALYQEYLKGCELEKTGAEIKETVKRRVLTVVPPQHEEAVTTAGNRLVFREVIQNRVDVGKLRQEQPEIADKYTVSTPTRPFKTFPAKKK